jgi:thioredoxin reductase
MAKVLYQIIDAQTYSGKNVLVVGGGDSAIEAVVGLARQEGNTVSLSYRKDRFSRIKKKNEDRLQELISRGKVNVLFNSEVTRITHRSVFLRVEQKHIEIPNDFVFVFIGGEPPFEMLKQIGVSFGGEIQRIAG